MDYGRQDKLSCGKWCIGQVHLSDPQQNEGIMSTMPASLGRLLLQILKNLQLSFSRGAHKIEVKWLTARSLRISCSDSRHSSLVRSWDGCVFLLLLSVKDKECEPGWPRSRSRSRRLFCTGFGTIVPVSSILFSVSIIVFFSWGEIANGLVSR